MMTIVFGNINDCYLKELNSRIVYYFGSSQQFKTVDRETKLRYLTTVNYRLNTIYYRLTTANFFFS